MRSEMPFLVLFISSAATILTVCFTIRIYSKLTTSWCKSRTCLMGRTVIVTGANTGIGYQTAIDFAKRGARVIMGCRNQQKAEEARRKIIKGTGNKNIVVKIIDMSSFASVRAFTKDIKDNEARLDILVNNAAIVGQLMGSNMLTEDNHDLLMQVNYFSVFLLTILLIDLMKKSESSRIINLSSIMAKYVNNFDVTQIDRLSPSLNNYGISKLCVNLFTTELAQRLQGTNITTYSVDPGAVATTIFEENLGSLMKILAKWFRSFFFKTPEEGAQTTIYCATTKEIQEHSGENFVNCKMVPKHKMVAMPGLSKQLWDLTKEIVFENSRDCIL